MPWNPVRPELDQLPGPLHADVAGERVAWPAQQKSRFRRLREKTARRLPRELLVDLYAARQYLRLDTLKEVGLRMPVEVYFKDPAVAAEFEGAGIDNEFTTPWEPGLRDGPTSARFAVVDYDSTRNDADASGHLGPEKQLLCRTRRQDGPRWKNQRPLSVSPTQCLGQRSKYPGILREQIRLGPQDQLGVRG